MQVKITQLMTQGSRISSESTRRNPHLVCGQMKSNMNQWKMIQTKYMPDKPNTNGCVYDFFSGQEDLIGAHW